ncbi:tetratricopeptide repeat protein [Carnobacterium divergens]|uniref:tetratricopeptide repeat protein n=1 Tax=Carnobacterium divergens TaxID=2748 RepID=UPI0028911EFE|nr:tetratricopeptide repeat protein [Carnobacterium divergens]MDT1996346.1 tetratricopeptide repeat protein [Carnobacterium divergens]
MSYGEQMIAALQDNQLMEAQDYFQEALAKDLPDELYILADTLYELGFLDETKAIYEQLLKEFPTDDELKIGLAEISIESDEIDEAMDWLLEIEEDSPAYPQALLVSADLYQVQGLYEVSEQKLLQAKEILPEEPILTFALAELYFTMGKYAQAIHGYEELLAQGIDDMTGINLSARCGSAYSAVGDFEQAIPYLETGVEENESTDLLFELGFTYLQNKEFRRTSETLFKLKELDPSYTSLYPYLAKSLEEENQLDKASEVIREGLRVDQFNHELFYYAAQIFLKLDNEEQAETYLEEALALEPESEVIQLALTNLFIKQERFEESVVAIQKALINEEADPQFYWNLAIAYENLEEYDAANEAYQKAYEAFKQNKDFLKAYALFLREEGNLKLTKTVLSEYLALEPTDEEMILLLDEINSEY